MCRPLIGITAEIRAERYALRRRYADLVVSVGGLPFILPCLPGECAAACVAQCHGLLLSGGDDPRMEAWGTTTHPRAKPVASRRQEFELALLDALDSRPQVPVLGVCLGMQLMGLHAGGALDQFLPESLATAGAHWGGVEHPVSGELADGLVHSHHRQAIVDPGSLLVAATAPDGVIEAIESRDRPVYLGVQWHPERTADETLGAGLIRRLVEAAAKQIAASV